ncbi:MAG: Ppx/GppA phosphatase family protein [Planctomycetota bacterium]
MPADSTFSRKSSTGIELVAVIDIGSSSLRMQIAEINHGMGTIRHIDFFSQAVSIGKDSFLAGTIEKKTIEDCVMVLRIYRDKLNEYGITNADRIRVIATSAVREATNRMAFCDRVFIATGFEIEPFDEAEIHRVTYLGIVPFIQSQPRFFAGQSLVCEVGGGTTELLLLDQSDVKFSKTYRLGSLRLQKMMEVYDVSIAKSRSMIENQVQQAISDFRGSTKHARPENVIGLGGDIRFAANEINHQPVGDELVELKLDDLESFVNEIVSQQEDNLAAKYHMSLPDAQSLGPGLLIQVMIARRLKVNRFLVGKSNLRDGVIKEMIEPRGWSDTIQTQIVQSAIRLGRKFKFNENHARHVAKLACNLFDELKDLHQLTSRYRGMLELACLLHEIGVYISSKSRHKHSAYLIRNSGLFGMGERDIDMVALVARYHRGAIPLPRHDIYSQLGRKSRVAVSKMAAILRIAKSLDVKRKQRVKSVRAEFKGNRLDLIGKGTVDITMEQLELRQNVGMFEVIFGKEVSLLSSRTVYE